MRIVYDVGIGSSKRLHWDSIKIVASSAKEALKVGEKHCKRLPKNGDFWVTQILLITVLEDFSNTKKSASKL